MDNIKQQLDAAILKYELLPASREYSELIARKDNVILFLMVLSGIGIKITRMTMWCFADKSNPECPHGMGGPWNAFGVGWFSEMCHWDEVEFEKQELAEQNNKQYADYYFDVFPKEQRYLECIVPAFELDVPRDWKREYHAARHRPWHSPPLLNGEVGPFDV